MYKIITKPTRTIRATTMFATREEWIRVVSALEQIGGHTLLVNAILSKVYTAPADARTIDITLSARDANTLRDILGISY